MDDFLHRIGAPFLDAHPEFSIADAEGDCVTFVGDYLLDAEYQGVRLVEQYGLRISVPIDFPTHLPKVNETTGLIPVEYEHLYSDRSFCLGVDGEIALKLSREPTLSNYLDTFVRGYLYSANFFFTYGRYPFGDRAHGGNGILDAYKELFDVDSGLAAFRLLGYIALSSYRGHLDCPCGSGIRARYCHGPLILDIIKSTAVESVRSDYHRILGQLKSEQEANAHRRRFPMVPVE